MAFSLNPESHEEGEKHVVSMPTSSIVSLVSIQTPYGAVGSSIARIHTVNLPLYRQPIIGDCWILVWGEGV